MLTEKQCSQCKQVKPVSEFNRHIGHRDGFNSCCRQCRNDNRRTSRNDRDRQYEREYRKTHNEDYRKRLRKHYWAHREYYLEDMKRRYWLNKEERQAANKRCYLRNPQRAIERADKWDAANPERRREISRLGQQRRRARKQSVFNDFTNRDWQEIKEAFGYRCAYCGKPHPKLTIDHVVPIFKGGAHTRSNIVPACPSCNFRKHTSPEPPFVIFPK
jgi:hypothetical protein